MLMHIINRYSFILFIFFFLGVYARHMEVPKLGVESELQLPATATLDLSRIFDLHPLSEARNRTHSSSSWILVGFVIAEPQQELPI